LPACEQVRFSSGSTPTIYDLHTHGLTGYSPMAPLGVRYNLTISFRTSRKKPIVQLGCRSATLPTSLTNSPMRAPLAFALLLLALTSLHAAALPAQRCSPSYPDLCIPPPPPDLDCKDVRGGRRPFQVLPPNPHHFDRDRDGWGCEPRPRRRT
jgi:hypothetical protein